VTTPSPAADQAKPEDERVTDKQEIFDAV